MPDLIHLGGRLAVIHGERDPAQADNWGPLGHPRVLYDAWAGEYLRHLREGDEGAAFLLLHTLRHETPGADPWRLLERVAAARACRITELEGLCADPVAAISAAQAERDAAVQQAEAATAAAIAAAEQRASRAEAQAQEEIRKAQDDAAAQVRAACEARDQALPEVAGQAFVQVERLTLVADRPQASDL